MEKSYKKVLIIAGSDSGGGAGIQADIKTVSALGCYASTAITAITAQNTLGVRGIHGIPPEMVEQQIDAVMEDIGADAVKIGMLHSVQVIKTVAKSIHKHKMQNVVLDPVMVAASGDKLIEDNTIDVLIGELIPRVDLITPNLPEAEILTGHEVKSSHQMDQTIHDLLQFGNNAVLLKGGHIEDERFYDLFQEKGRKNPVKIEKQKIETVNKHGTGCTLSSAIASFLATGLTMEEAVKEAGNYIDEAMLAGKDYRVGRGHGPVNHFYAPKKLQ